jgi:glutathione S-transferase
MIHNGREMSPARELSEEALDLTLFHYRGCWYCHRVWKALDELRLVIADKNIHEDPDAKHEIMAARGRRTVPVLRIVEPDGSVRYMGESRDIVRYLRERFGDEDTEPKSDFFKRLVFRTK